MYHNDDIKILQILPADNWVAVFRDDPFSSVKESVVCFALIERKTPDGEVREVRPMMVGNGSVGIVFCSEIANFDEIKRLQPISVLHEAITTLAERVEEATERG